MEDFIEFEAIYIGSAEDSSQDQSLGEIKLEVPRREAQQFNWRLKPPDFRKIKNVEDLMGVSALMICAFYKGQEFFRCSYFVFNWDQRFTKEGEPLTQDYFQRVTQNFDIGHVLKKFNVENPKIIVKPIDWNSNSKLHNLMKIFSDKDLQ